MICFSIITKLYSFQFKFNKRYLNELLSESYFVCNVSLYTEYNLNLQYILNYTEEY